MKWSLRAMLLLTAIVGTALGVSRMFWVPTAPNHNLFLGFYLVLLAATGVAAFPRATPLRPGFMGAFIFGILYLVCVLNAGFGVMSYSQAQVFAQETVVGYALLGLSFMTSQLCAILVWPKNEIPK
jgi:hypothetical protein